MSSDLESSLLPLNGVSRRGSSKYEEPPAAQYGAISEKFRQTAPKDIQCSVFCGGRRCRYESGFAWLPEETAIEGVFSHWVTNEILAMARPNTESIRKHKILDQFHKKGIKTIVNLQQPGEHSSCGNQLDSSGFSYNPQVFMDNDIFFYNFRWKDYGTVSFTMLLDMVKVVAFAISEGKVAIHCHAGLGRTGVLIACYLIYHLRCKANDAIKFVRLKRPGSIQTRSQLDCIQEFAQNILPHFVVFTTVIPKLKDGLKLSQFLTRQRQYLHGLEARHLKLIPKIIYIICERLLYLAGCHSTSSRSTSSRQGSLVGSISYHLDTMYSFCNFFLSASLDDGQFRPVSQLSTVESLGGSSDTSLDSGVGQSAGSTQSGRVVNLPWPPPVLHEQDEREDSADQAQARAQAAQSHIIPVPPPPPPPPLPPVDINAPSSSSGCARINLNPGEPSKAQPVHPPMEASSSRVEDAIKTNGEEFHISHHEENGVGLMYGDFDQDSGDESLDSMLLEDSSQEDLTMNACYRELSSRAELRADDARAGPSHVSYNAKDISQALLANHRNLNPEFMTALRQYQKELNLKASAWDRLERETDLLMLTALLWSWIENLKDPILNKQDLIYIVLRPEKTVETLSKIERGSRFTMEYLIHFIARLHLESDELCDNLLRRLVCSLSKQCLMIKGVLHPVGVPWGKMREGTQLRVFLFVRRLFDIISGLPPKTMPHIPPFGGHNPNRPNGKERNYLGINIMACAIGRSGSGFR